jgi:hypothetical protein
MERGTNKGVATYHHHAALVEHATGFAPSAPASSWRIAVGDVPVARPAIASIISKRRWRRASASAHGSRGDSMTLCYRSSRDFCRAFRPLFTSCRLARSSLAKYWRLLPYLASEAITEGGMPCRLAHVYCRGERHCRSDSDNRRGTGNRRQPILTSIRSCRAREPTKLTSHCAR